VRFIEELKRRKVFKVAVAYVVVSWFLIEVAATLFPTFGAPEWILKVFSVVLLLGLPVALIFAWVFDMTPDGVKRTPDLDDGTESEDVLKGKFPIYVSAVVLTVLMAFALNHYIFPDAEPVESAPPPVEKQLSIAVLPLVNMSAISDNAFFANGVHEEILTYLSYIDDLKVTSRTSTMKYLGSDLSISEIGQELMVRYVLEGSVRRVDNHVRITVQLIDADTDTHLWASNYDHDLIDVFAVQSAVAKEISDSIHLEIQPQTVGVLSDMPTQSVKAYDLYMKAKSIDRTERETEDSLARTQDLLEQAVQEDPNFVEAWGFLNEIYDHTIRNMLTNDWYAGDGNEAMLQELTIASKQALDKAVSLDPDNVETLLAQASDYVAEQDGGFFRAQRKLTLDRAIELYPDDPVVNYTLAWWYELGGDLINADIAFRKAIELDPFNARILSGALNHYTNNVENADISRQLLERLDNSLGGSSRWEKSRVLVQQIVATVDESMIDKYIQLEGLDLHEVTPFSAGAVIAISGMGIEKILQFEDEISIDENSNEALLSKYVDTNLVLLDYYRQEENIEKTRKIAERILSINRVNGTAFVWIQPSLDVARVTAYLAVGDRVNAERTVDMMLNNQSTSYDPWGAMGVLALAKIDPDRAVELIMADRADENSWDGTDWVALFYRYNMNLVQHPDMKAFYTKEGKWLDYLARRIPGYLD
jgi:TolB-like protein/tetratricopeptide (TPR) repeat protein